MKMLNSKNTKPIGKEIDPNLDQKQQELKKEIKFHDIEFQVSVFELI